MTKSFFIIALVFTASFFYSSTAKAQIEYPEDKVSWKFDLEQSGEEVTVVVTVSIVKNWHIYANFRSPDSFSIPTDIVLEKSENYKKVGGIIEPEAEHIFDEIVNEDLYLHSGTFKMKQKIKVLSNKDFVLKGTFSFQTCDETHCLPPFETDFEINVKGVEDEIVESQVDKIDFSKIMGNETVDEDGNNYVKVNERWYKVPEGNSAEFYRKYIILGGKHEE